MDTKWFVLIDSNKRLPMDTKSTDAIYANKAAKWESPGRYEVTKFNGFEQCDGGSIRTWWIRIDRGGLNLMDTNLIDASRPSPWPSDGYEQHILANLYRSYLIHMNSD